MFVRLCLQDCAYKTAVKVMLFGSPSGQSTANTQKNVIRLDKRDKTVEWVSTDQT